MLDHGLPVIVTRDDFQPRVTARHRPRTDPARPSRRDEMEAKLVAGLTRAALRRRSRRRRETSPATWPPRRGRPAMKILLSSYVFAPSIGGIETVSALIAPEFIKAGHEVVLITLTRKDGRRRAPYPVIRNPSPRKLLELVRWCDVYFQNNISLLLAWPLLFVRRPWVVAHHTWIRPFGERLQAPRAAQDLPAALQPQCHHQPRDRRAHRDAFHHRGQSLLGPGLPPSARDHARPGTRLSGPARLRQGRRHAHPRAAPIAAVGADPAADRHWLRLGGKVAAPARAQPARRRPDRFRRLQAAGGNSACSTPTRSLSCPRACRSLRHRRAGGHHHSGSSSPPESVPSQRVGGP